MVIKSFIRDRKLNISLVFITQPYFPVPRDIRLNSTHYFVMKTPNKLEHKQIASHNLSDIDFKDFTNPYKKGTKKSYSFFVIDATFVPDNPLHFKVNVIKRL